MTKFLLRFCLLFYRAAELYLCLTFQVIMLLLACCFVCFRLNNLLLPTFMSHRFRFLELLNCRVLRDSVSGSVLKDNDKLGAELTGL